MAVERGRAVLGFQTIAADSTPDLLALARECGQRNLVYFEQPARGFAVLGLGAALELKASGPKRFTALSDAARDALGRLGARGGLSGEPLAMGGFGFFDRRVADPAWREFPAARLLVPKLLWVRRAQGTFLTVVSRTRREQAALIRRAQALAGAAGARRRQAPALLGANGAAGLSPIAALCAASGEHAEAALEAEESERARWHARVNAVLRRIERGELAKVVLARKKIRPLNGRLKPAELLERLRSHRAGCLSFWIAAQKTSFVGSTPELLLRVSAGRFACGALAGSAPRALEPARDRAQAQALLASRKNAREHQLVVAALKAALRPLSRTLRVGARPRVRAFPEAFHLFTPISGALKRRLSALELAGKLHPTPAVCGVPTARAMALLSRAEADRGWYAGGVGWMDARGDGEFAVALRSALLEERRVLGWAGAGIVAGSDPDAEFAETEDKLGALFAELRS